MTNKSYLDNPEDYQTFKAGDRFMALMLGYQHTYRVKRIETRVIKYNDGETVLEPIIVTKSGLVWATHVCGVLLDFYGRVGVDYVPSPARKTWRSMQPPLRKGEQIIAPYAIGER